MKFFRITLIISTILLGSSEGFSQEIVEDKMPNRILMNHYDRYPDSKENYWKLLKLKDQKVYQNNFQHEGIKKAARYDKNGDITVEEVTLKKDKLHPSIQTKLTTKYRKFKIVKLAKITTFKNFRPYQEYNVMSVKVSGKVISELVDNEFANMLEPKEIPIFK